MKTFALWGGVLILLTMAAYVPAVQGGYIWDDDAHVTNNGTLRSLDGLRRIWFQIHAVPQYYPLVHTTFWVEYHLWGLAPLGYHLVNVLLHGSNAVLLWLLLKRLSLPAPWLAAAIFALHPVHVESVAWITERKNTLSAFFYLLAMLCFLGFFRMDAAHDSHAPSSIRSRSRRRVPIDAGPLDGPPQRIEATVVGSRRPPLPEITSVTRPTTAPSTTQWGLYAAGTLLFLGALLSKTVTASLPAALLLLLWWKRHRLQRRDATLLLPLFALGAAFGLWTAWMEKHYVGARGEAWELSLLERLLVAGRAVWFYAQKLVWPQDLTFIYPRWRIDAGVLWQYLFPLAALASIGVLWTMRRRWGKGPLVAALFFGGTLTPALGFFDVYPMRYSFVADHFQYLASIGVIVLATAFGWNAAQWADQRLIRTRAPSSPRQRIALVGAESARPSRTSGRGSPRSTHATRPENRAATGRIGYAAGILVVAVLGVLTWRQGHIYKDAETLWLDTIAKNRSAWMAHNNLGLIRVRQGRVDEGIALYTEALRLEPHFTESHINIGNALAKLGRTEEAVRHYEEAVRLEPRSPEAHYNLANSLFDQGDYQAAIEHYSETLRLRPTDAAAHSNLGQTLHRQGKVDEAILHHVEALRLRPGLVGARYDLAEIFLEQGRIDEAIVQYLEAVRLQPDRAEPRYNLAAALAIRGRTDEAIAQYREVLRIKADFADARSRLNDLLGRQGRVEDPEH